MPYPEFYERFGGAYRSKNLLRVPRLPADWWARCRERLRGKNRLSPVNKRFYSLPRRARLPKDFIRLDPWEGEYLFMLAARATRGIVEIGRFHGGSSFLLACANDKVPITSIDLEPRDDDGLRMHLATHRVGDNLDLVVGDSQGGEHPSVGDVDLLFIDGDHSYEGCTRDLENWFPRVVPGGHVVLHDCYFGSPVQDSVLDFTACQEVDFVLWPWRIASHWHTSGGSLAHFLKRG